jgi:hypothetical protein
MNDIDYTEAYIGMILEARIAELQNALREAMRYVESTDGTRGELAGTAVGAHEYLRWVRLTRQSPTPPQRT